MLLITLSAVLVFVLDLVAKSAIEHRRGAPGLRVGSLVRLRHAPGQPLTLRKASGRKVTVVFFNPVSEPSVSAVRDAVEAAGEKTIVLAVSDGSASRSSELGPAIVVPDERRQIASSYGVTMWPTIFSLDERGIVRSISYGRSTRGEKSRA